jgi:hypothetical protein
LSVRSKEKLFVGNHPIERIKGFVEKERIVKRWQNNSLWLFPGEKEENHLAERSVQKIFEAPCLTLRTEYMNIRI